MKKSIFMVCMLSILLLVSETVQAQETFIVGVAPHTSARVILQMYQPLRLYLEKTLGRPVDIITAPDFTEFARRGLNQAYDLAITTGHQARLFQTDGGYTPLLTYKADFRSVVLAAKNGPIHAPRDLTDKKVLGLSPSSLVTLWGLHWLTLNRVERVNITHVSASDSVAQMVIADEASAGFISLANFERLDPEVKAKLYFLAESPSMAGRVYVLNRRQAKLKNKIASALWAFAKTEAAKQYFKENYLEGYRELSPSELNEMDPYAQEVRRELAGGSK